MDLGSTVQLADGNGPRAQPKPEKHLGLEDLDSVAGIVILANGRARHDRGLLSAAGGLTPAAVFCGGSLLLWFWLEAFTPPCLLCPHHARSPGRCSSRSWGRLKSCRIAAFGIR